MTNKVSSAENQQERLRTSNWIVGFVDGEGAFLISILKNPKSKTGWQVFPEFIVTQGAKSKEVLYLIKEFFGCGQVYLNRRHDNHTEDLYRYCVRSLGELSDVIIPFFKEFPLKTHKAKDFEIFCQAFELISQRKHLTTSGLTEIANLAMQMNRKVKPKFLESPLTIRQTAVRDSSSTEEIVASA